LAPGPIYGSGGTLGACLRELLNEQMPGLLGILVFASITFVGIFLAATSSCAARSTPSITPASC